MSKEFREERTVAAGRGGMGVLWCKAQELEAFLQKTGARQLSGVHPGLFGSHGSCSKYPVHDSYAPKSLFHSGL